MATGPQILPPEPFPFRTPEEWPKWIRRFQRYRIASGLISQEEEAQVNMLLYCMGDKADDILTSFSLTEDQAKRYDTVKDKFDKHFIPQRNIIFERARFNSRKQEEDETVDAFVTALHGLAEHCNYGALHNEMIRDRVVVGIRDVRLSERLQLDATLTLETAVKQARQAEVVKSQQPVVRGDLTTSSNIGAVEKRKKEV